MSAAPSLYRRHRPRTFADVVGQEHVVRTLRNAVTQNKLHHAYLFVGSRGTGKTSMAKILASCLNCTGASTRPTIEPCGACDSCVSIAGATSMDVIEMDAASNNSVDDVRELRESVAFAPVSGGYKVYILDEAHMLTTAAWNAFLKTLEEPPPNTIFVMATTEAAKVLPTVVDRCHRFDFQRPTAEQLGAVVSRVAGKESINIGPDAVALLARHATGSFRDALGTLEQLVTYSGDTITVEDVLAVLGVADAELLFGAYDAIGAHDARAALLAAARLVSTGRDVVVFMKDLEAHGRELLVCRTLGEVPAEIAVTPDRDARLLAQARALSPADVVRMLDLLADALRAVKDGADARTHLELALVKAATPEVDASTKALLARLERLESAGVAAVAAPGPAAAPTPVPGPTAAAPAPPTAAAPTAPPAPSAPAPAAPPPPAPSAGAPVPPVAAPSAPAPPAPEAAVAPPPAAPAAPAAAPPAPVAVAEPPAATVSHTLHVGLVVELWSGILESVGESNSMLAACLLQSTPVGLEDGELVIAFPPSLAFQKKRAEDPASRELVSDAVKTLTGSRPRLRFELREADPTGEDAPLSEDEWLERFKSEFDAEEIVVHDEPTT